jgi:hypothetical protein
MASVRWAAKSGIGSGEVPPKRFAIVYQEVALDSKTGQISVVVVDTNILRRGLIASLILTQHSLTWSCYIRHVIQVV